MLEKVNQDPEGYVELNLICSFTRMREILKVNTRFSRPDPHRPRTPSLLHLPHIVF